MSEQNRLQIVEMLYKIEKKVLLRENERRWKKKQPKAWTITLIIMVELEKITEIIHHKMENDCELCLENIAADPLFHIIFEKASNIPGLNVLFMKISIGIIGSF